MTTTLFGPPRPSIDDEATVRRIFEMMADPSHRLGRELLDDLAQWNDPDNSASPSEAKARQPLLRSQLLNAFDMAESLDGYDLARYLHDTHGWPADQHLVEILSLCWRYHDDALAELVRAWEADASR